jgi:hypothetical protein
MHGATCFFNVCLCAMRVVRSAHLETPNWLMQQHCQPLLTPRYVLRTNHMEGRGSRALDVRHKRTYVEAKNEVFYATVFVVIAGLNMCSCQYFYRVWVFPGLKFVLNLCKITCFLGLSTSNKCEHKTM